MKDSNEDNLTNVLFAIYLISLFWIIVLKFDVPLGSIRSINLIPFREPLILNGRLDIGEMILNVLIFVPLGVYSGILFKTWITGKKLFLSFLSSLIIEGLQFTLAVGTFDITDIITNTLGGIIGLMIYNGIEIALKNSIKVQKFINIIALTGTVLMILLLLFLKISRLWIFRLKF